MPVEIFLGKSLIVGINIQANLFVSYVYHLLQNGIDTDNKCIGIKLRAVVFDAPVKAYKTESRDEDKDFTTRKF